MKADIKKGFQRKHIAYDVVSKDINLKLLFKNR